MSPLPHVTPGAVDLLLLVLIVIAWPLVETFWSYPRSLRALAAGAPGARVGFYRHLIAPSWLFSVAIASLWLVRGRPWSGLFVRIGTPLQTAIGAAIAVAFLLLLRLQQRQVAARPAVLPALRRQLAGVEPVMPHTHRERAHFRWVAITAGITEEFMSRGFVFWCFHAWGGPVVATLASAILFGFGHLYLGLAQVPKTAIGGLVACLVVLASGSLWPAMVMHVAVDWENGELGYLLFGPTPAAARPPASPAAPDPR